MTRMSPNGTQANETLSVGLPCHRPMRRLAGMTPRSSTCRCPARGGVRCVGWIGILRHLLRATEGAAPVRHASKRGDQSGACHAWHAVSSRSRVAFLRFGLCAAPTLSSMWVRLMRNPLAIKALISVEAACYLDAQKTSLFGCVPLCSPIRLRGRCCKNSLPYTET